MSMSHQGFGAKASSRASETSSGAIVPSKSMTNVRMRSVADDTPQELSGRSELLRAGAGGELGARLVLENGQAGPVDLLVAKAGPARPDVLGQAAGLHERCLPHVERSLGERRVGEGHHAMDRDAQAGVDQARPQAHGLPGGLPDQLAGVASAQAEHTILVAQLEAP